MCVLYFSICVHILRSLFLGFVRVASLLYFVTCLLNKKNIFSEDTEDFPKEILRRIVRKMYYFGIVPEFALLGLDVSSILKALHKNCAL